jgi:ATP-dependent Clp protease ATP-binding subunit ClpX
VPPGSGRKHPQQEFIQLDTRNILFICGGAFAQLAEVVRKRVHRRGSLGFVDEEALVKPLVDHHIDHAENEMPLPEDPAERQREQRIRKMEKERSEESKMLGQVLPDDLLSYGLIPEFIGRLPVAVSLEALTRRTLVRILTEPKDSVVRQYQRLFAMDNVRLEFENEALETVATEAFLRRTGARGLRSIVEDALLDIMFEIPSRDDIVRCVVTKETFTQNRQPMLYNASGQPIFLGRELRSAA